MVSHTILHFDFSLFTVTLDLHPDSAIAVILCATAVTGPFLYLLYTLAPSRPPTCTDLIFGPSWYGCPGVGGNIQGRQVISEKLVPGRTNFRGGGGGELNKTVNMARTAMKEMGSAS